MKTIIMTIQPHYLHEIRSGRKIYELRTRVPKLEEPYRVLCCESGSGGRIIAEFIADRVIRLKEQEIASADGLLNKLCLNERELTEYLYGRDGYLIHVSNLIDYCMTRGFHVTNVRRYGLKRAPQSWQYVKGESK